MQFHLVSPYKLKHLKDSRHCQFFHKLIVWRYSTTKNFKFLY